MAPCLGGSEWREEEQHQAGGPVQAGEREARAGGGQQGVRPQLRGVLAFTAQYSTVA